MNKEINPRVMATMIGIALIVVVVIAVRMFGDSSSNAAHPGDGKFLPRHFSQAGGTRPAPNAGNK